MTTDEVDAVAAELAKAGGVCWHSGQERGPVKIVMDRYRERARLAIAAFERMRATKHSISAGSIADEQIGPDVQATLDVQAVLEPVSDEAISVGSLVLYRPPGDKRTYPCRVKEVDGSRAYLVPEIPSCTGWVDLKTPSTPAIQ
jgi:hypothetical protein